MQPKYEIAESILDILSEWDEIATCFRHHRCKACEASDVLMVLGAMPFRLNAKEESALMKELRECNRCQHKMVAAANDMHERVLDLAKLISISPADPTGKALVSIALCSTRTALRQALSDAKGMLTLSRRALGYADKLYSQVVKTINLMKDCYEVHGIILRTEGPA